jgi:Na+-translocating ferredoxin:NAD+ oxidoreductase RnfD subunit
MTVPSWSDKTRLGGLRRFAAAITILNVLGHFWLGFEPSFAQPVVSLGVAYSTELALEWIDARACKRPLAFAGGKLIDFLLPAHITALAIAMLIYSGDRLMPVAFASATAIGSKAILKWNIDGRSRHLFNPSNLGITLTLLTFPLVGIAPPYQFTEHLGSIGDWVLPVVLCIAGSFLNWRFTHRWPLITAWLGTFALQAFARHLLLGQVMLAALMPMTGMAFLLFTFYMLTDPPTTPPSVRGQIVFGATVAATYGILMVSHVVFGLFFSLAITSTLRGFVLALRAMRATPRAAVAAQAKLATFEIPRVQVPATVETAVDGSPKHARL